MQKIAAKVVIGQIYDGTISKMDVIRTTIDTESYVLFSQMMQLLHYATLLQQSEITITQTDSEIVGLKVHRVLHIVTPHSSSPI